MLTALIGIIFVSFLFPYGSELFQRLWWFGLVTMSYFASKNINKRNILIMFIAFLLISPPLLVISRYEGEKWDYIPKSEIVASEFFYKSATTGYLAGTYPLGEFNKKYTTINLGKPEEWNQTQNRIFLNRQLKRHLLPDSADNKNLYILISDSDNIFYNRFYNNSRFFTIIESDISTSKYYNEIYNSNIRIFIHT